MGERSASTESGTGFLLAALAFRELEFVTFHVHPATAEGHAFGLEAETLLEARFSLQLNFSSGSKHALPGESEGTAQHTDDLAGGTGVSGGTGNSTVGRDLAAGDTTNSGEDGGVEGHGMILPALRRSVRYVRHLSELDSGGQIWLSCE